MTPKVDPENPEAMRERYCRAMRLTAPKVAAHTAAVAVEGYWLNAHQFYFRKEGIDLSSKRLISVPSIADARTSTVEPVIGLADLAAVLSECSHQPVDIEALQSADFDMPGESTLAVSVGGADYLVDTGTQTVREQRVSLTNPALYSPDGRHACFLNGYDIWLRDLASGEERALTKDGERNYAYGQESETCLAALAYRQHPYPLGLWSPDSRWFITQRIDERHLPDYLLVEHAPPAGGRPVLHTIKYSMSADPLPRAIYVAMDIASGNVTSFNKWPGSVPTLSTFFSRTVWFGGKDEVLFLRSDVHCKWAELIRLDLASGSGRVVLRETVQSGYLDLHPGVFGIPNVRTVSESNEIVWFSERDGWGHLYLYDASSGKLKNQITQGPWLVRDIVHIDARGRSLVFLAGGIDPTKDPARRSLCRVNLDGSGFEVLLSENADIYVPLTDPCGIDQNRPYRPSSCWPGISPDSRFGVVRYANPETGNRTEIVDLLTRDRFQIGSVVPDSRAGTARQFTAPAADGVTQLFGLMFLPPDFNPTRRYPLIDYIYPGPHIAHQPQSFRSVNSAIGSALAELGFIAIMLDTRATPIRSRSFQQFGYPRLLEPQLADHAAVVSHLCRTSPYLDERRVGMIGYSAGGGATVRALCEYGNVFRVGVAVAGVNDPSCLMAAWVDHYRGPRPASGWAEQPNNSIVRDLTGKLFLIAADLDENVHLSHTLTVADALIRANKDFDLLIVPNERHYLLMTSGYVLRRVWDFLVRNLMDQTPPVEFEMRYEAKELGQFGRSLFREFRQSL